jgi:PAS domain S-box-containing protein
MVLRWEIPKAEQLSNRGWTDILLLPPNPPDMPPHQKLTPEQRFQLLLDAASDYALFFTDEQSNITEWSTSAEKMLGYTEDEALQMNGRDIFTPEDRAAGVPQQEMGVAIQRGQANDERWHLRKNGSRFFAVGRLVALKDRSGAVVGFVKILRDATPHKTLEQALHASDEQFRATFAQAPVGMVLIDLDGRIRQVNAAFCHLTGYDQAQLEGREAISLTTPEDRPVVQHHLNRLLIGIQTSATMEKRLQRADGSTVWVQNSIALLRDAEGRPLSFIDLGQDISVLKLSTEQLEQVVRQRTAALEHKTKQMEAFCYTVAHDLRAPLRTIAGYADFLREDYAAALTEDGCGYLHKITTAAARLDRLIIDLLAYTRVQQVPMLQDEVDLLPIVNRAVEHARRDHRIQDLAITIAPSLGKVRAEAVTLEHIFLNLVSNAVKFAREGVAPEVRIFSESLEAWTRVWVEDNGIGIDPRFKERVFGMFERLHPHLKIPGTGVGLAIVAMAMQRLGGSCGVEPNQPHGSRFWLEFPK